ncbi:MAG: hypothetical protein JWM27_2040 [Gemmatimonadetes bacterium]|nr:hypothetical protein [Gemmatimonadota bacterium]
MNSSHLIVVVLAWAAVAWAAAVLAAYFVSYRRFKRGIRRSLLRLARGDDLVLHIASGDARLLREIAKTLVPPRRPRQPPPRTTPPDPPPSNPLHVVINELPADP